MTRKGNEMKLLESASQNKGAKVVFTFDTGHQLSVYRNTESWISNKNHKVSAVVRKFPNLYKKMLVAIKVGV
jgi:hypothetical protein